ncbi:hypothetical protein [Salinisphaera sp. S4-8]|uniref:hypothetical protein n=1 Tax=Salinisphaera sp. S4-8 TaxID=633357 RepID=UPI00333E35E2
MHIQDDRTEQQAVAHVHTDLRGFLDTLCLNDSSREAIVILACLGGFAGSCAARAVCQYLATNGMPHTTVATLPFQIETTARRERAGSHLRKLGRTTARAFVVNGGAIEYQLGAEFTLRHGFHLFDARVLSSLDLARQTALDVGFGDDLP